MQLSSVKQQEINDALITTIDDTLESLGHELHMLVDRRLKIDYSIDHDELPYRLETLEEALEKTFGAVATKSLKERIAKKLASTLNVPLPDPPTPNLVQQVQEIKKIFASRSKSQ